MNLRRLAEAYRSNPGPEALIRLLRGSQGLVHTLCYRVLRHAQDSEDAAQQVLLELIDELPRLKDAEHVERWLHRVSFHVALNLKRGRRRSMTLPRNDGPTVPNDADDRSDRLHEEIARLNPDLQAVLVEHYFERRSLEQIADRRGCSTTAVWKKIEKAREQLRVALGGAAGAASLAWLTSTLEAHVAVPAPPDLLSPAILSKARASAGRVAGGRPPLAAVGLGAVAIGILGLIAVMRSGVPSSSPERPAAPAERASAAEKSPVVQAPPPAGAAPGRDPRLPEGVVSRLGDTGIRHALHVTSVSFSPDGSKVASCGGREVSLWDLSASREVRRIQGDARSVEWVAFSPDGKAMAYAGNDHLIRLGSLEGPPRLLRNHAHHVFQVVFFPDGKSLASASADQTIRIWDVESGRELKVLRGHEDGVHSIAVSPDGWRVAGRSQDRTVRVWNASSGEQLLRIPVEDDSTHPLPVLFSPDGRAVVFHDAGRIRFVDPHHGREAAPPLEDEDPPPAVEALPAFQGRKRWNGPVRTLTFSADGEILISGRSSGLIRLWHLPTRTQKSSFSVPSLHSLALSPDATLIAVGGDRGVTFWDPSSGTRRGASRGHESSVLALAVSPCGESLASVGADEHLQVWDLATGIGRRRTPVPMFPRGWMRTPLLAFSSQGHRLTYAGYRALDIRNTADGSPVEEVPLNELFPAPRDGKSRTIIERIVDGKPVREELPTGMATPVPGGISRDGSRIALAGRRTSASNSPSLRLAVFDVHARKGILVRDIAGTVHVRCVAFSPDDRLIAVAVEETVWDKDGNSSQRFPPVEVIDLSSGRTRASLTGHDRWVQSIRFSPDAGRLVTGSGDQTARIWDGASGKLLKTLKGHQGGVAHVAWSPDGAIIASADDDSRLILWHAETGLMLRSSEGPGLLVDSLTFDAKGGRLITGMSDGSILLWSVPRP